MVQQILKFILENWVNWLFLGVTGMAGYCYRRLVVRQKAESRSNKALREGVQALLRDRIIETYNHYNDKGYCPIYAKESMRRMYAAYHALGGNDVATELKDKLLTMPTDSTTRKHREVQ